MSQSHSYTFSDKLTLPLNVAADTKFNRFTLTYTASHALRGELIYTAEGREVSDPFFLEPGTHTFSCVILDYLKEIHAEAPTAFTFAHIPVMTGANPDTYESPAEVSLTVEAVSFEVYPVYNNTADNTYYLENNRYKLGIRMNWGGGINYIEDNESKLPEVKNIINQFDTGRLIQQSYYGIGAHGDYQPEVFNNSRWVYNPVQGGDQHNNHSRIIDIVVKEHAVYIKSQPQDWSMNGRITPSYMENTYTLDGDYIRVDNRFTDFSGWLHPCTSQEVPAFYTVSCLDRFTWYGGTKPWTGDELSVRTDLKFWGDPKYARDSAFHIRKSNTETWCAWTNTDADYGLGLYVPNTDYYTGGRHLYDHSPDPMSASCNYVAPLVAVQIKPFTPIEYSYLMTAGSVAEIRQKFTEAKDFADNVSLKNNGRSMRVPDDYQGQ